MIPVLFEIGPLKIHSFGLMVLVAFAVGAWLVILELRRREISPSHLEGYPMYALIGGIVGARLYWMAEHFDRVVADPLGGIIGGAVDTEARGQLLHGIFQRTVCVHQVAVSIQRGEIVVNAK